MNEDITDTLANISDEVDNFMDALDECETEKELKVQVKDFIRTLKIYSGITK